MDQPRPMWSKWSIPLDTGRSVGLLKQPVPVLEEMGGKPLKCNETTHRILAARQTGHRRDAWGE